MMTLRGGIPDLLPQNVQVCAKNRRQSKTLKWSLVLPAVGQASVYIYGNK